MKHQAVMSRLMTTMKHTPNNPKILLSLDSLQSWGGSAIAGALIKAAIDVVDGFEFGVSYDDLRSWQSGIRLGIRALPPPFFDIGREVADLVFGKSANLLRLSPLKFLSVGREFEVASDIRGLLANVRIEQVCIDLSEVSEERAKLFVSMLPSEIQVVQVNSALPQIATGVMTNALNLSRAIKDSHALVYLNGPGQVFDSQSHFELVELASRALAQGLGTGFVYSLPIPRGDVVDGLGELVRLREMVCGGIKGLERRVAF